jgi:SAM-dependent methyltransferase
MRPLRISITSFGRFARIVIHAKGIEMSYTQRAFTGGPAGSPSAADYVETLRAVLMRHPEILARFTARGARILELYCGTAWLSIGLLKRWPTLHATGIEADAAKVALAREKLTGAGLSGRMELRTGGAETLTDRALLDIVTLPASGIDDPRLADILLRANAALKPGGWLLFALSAAEGVGAAGARSWGGSGQSNRVGAELRKAGFGTIRECHLPRGPILFLAASR